MKMTKVDMGYAFTELKYIDKDLMELDYLSPEERNNIRCALLLFYTTINKGLNILGDSRKDKFCASLLRQLAYDMGEAIISLNELEYYYKDNYSEYAEQLIGYDEKELIALARKTYDELGSELDFCGDDNFYEHSQEWVDALY